MPAFALATLGLAVVVAGQYFPPTPEGVKVVESRHQEGVRISYKEVFEPLSLNQRVDAN